MPLSLATRNDADLARHRDCNGGRGRGEEQIMPPLLVGGGRGRGRGAIRWHREGAEVAPA